jgi:uncharacterized protein (TIGR02265 family)
LEERLPLVPASAKLRGLYFKNNLTMLKREGHEQAFLRYYPERYSAVRWYPVADFLEQLAVAGSLLCGPEKVHEGMRRIGHNKAVAFAESLLGRAMMRFFSNDPVKALQQAAAGRRQSCTYGRWETSFVERGVAVMKMYEEYLWIESYVAGAGRGTFASIVGRDIDVEATLVSRFEGRLTLRWDPDDI